jgi:hypothetical protein
MMPAMHATTCSPRDVGFALLALTAALLLPRSAQAQLTDDQIQIRRIAATPIGALPPTATLMPASRNHNYWGTRIQAGHRRGGSEPDQSAVAGGIDLQWRGGSVFGVMVGYRTTECAPADPECGGGALLGARAQLNVISGGSTIGALVGDYSATTTLGTEIGFGYARDALPGIDACTVDLGVPISLAMLQSVRLVAFMSPGVVWAIRCGAEAPAPRATFLTSLGIGMQQLGGRALDLYIDAQKFFRDGAGYQLGISFTYVRMP